MTERDLKMSAGAREYEARRRDRIADRLEAQGDHEGARRERGAADDLRRASRGPVQVPKPDRFAPASPGVYRIYR
jgi:hypothetical protein